MNKLIWFEICLCVVISLTSCKDDSSSSTDSAVSVAPPYTTVPILADYSSISDPRKRWEAYHLSNYVIDQRQWGAWIRLDTLRLYMANGEKYLIIRPSTNVTVDVEWPVCKSVDELFGMIDFMNLNHRPGDTLYVEYHPRFGYPTRIWYSNNFLTDTETAYETSNLFRVLY